MSRNDRGSVAIILAVVALLIVAGAVAFFTMSGSKGGDGSPLSLTSGASLDYAAGSAFHELPADSFLALGVADLTQFSEQLASTDFGKMLLDPEFRAKLRKSVEVEGEEQLAKLDAGLSTLSELTDLGVRSVALSVFPIGGSETPGSAVIAACDDPAKVAAWLEKKDDPTYAPSDQGTTAGINFTCRGDACMATRSNSLILAGPRAAMERILDGSGGHLDASERFRAAATANRSSSAGMFGLVDFAAVLAAYQSKLDTALADQAPEAHKLLDLIKLESWQYAAFAEQVEDGMFRGRMTVAYDRAAGSLLASLMESPNGETHLETMLPVDSTAVSISRMRDPAATWDQMLAAIRGTLDDEKRAGLDQQLAMTQMLGFDLRDDVFASLGGEMGFAYTFDFANMEPEQIQQAMSSMRFMLVIGVVDAAKLEGLLARLDVMGVIANNTPVGDGKLRELAVPVPGLTPAIALANGKLVLGTNAAEVRSALDGTIASLGDDAEYQKMRKRLPKEVSGVGYQKAFPLRLEDFIEMIEKQMTTERGKQKTSFERVSALAGAIESYTAAAGSPPSGSLDDIIAELVPDHAIDLTDFDAWGNVLKYHTDGTGYVVWSTGSDGQDDQDWTSCASDCSSLTAEIDKASADLVAARGTFVRWPKESDGEGSEIPAEAKALLADLDQRIAAMPPTVTVVRTVDPGIVYEYVTPLPASAFGAAAAAVGIGALQSKGGTRANAEAP